MKRNFKKAISFILSVLIICTSLTLVSFAAEEDTNVLPVGFMDKIDAALMQISIISTHIKEVRFLEPGKVEKNGSHIYIEKTDSYVDNVEAVCDLSESIIAYAAYSSMYPNPGYVIYIASENQIALKETENLFTVTRNSNTINGPEKITGLKNLDSSKVETMSYMFYNCQASEIDLNGFDMSGVTDVSNMFAGCSNLSKLSLDWSDMSNVTDVSYMFAGCSKLSKLSLDLSDMSNVTNMSHMFAGCPKLSQLDLSTITTGKVADMSYMFSNCSKLAEVDISGINVAEDVTTEGMFDGCKALKYVFSDGIDFGDEINGAQIVKPNTYDFVVEEGNITLNIGERYEINTACVPSMAHQNVKFVSDNLNVATVDQNGTITAVGGGKAKIIVLDNDADNKPYKTITVSVPEPEPEPETNKGNIFFFMAVILVIIDYFKKLFGLL